MSETRHIRMIRHLGLAATALLALGIGATRAEAGGPPADSQVEAGETLFLTGCASCHGTGGVGTQQGPSLVGVGAASADFQLRTGRMPAAGGRGQQLSKPAAYDNTDIEALVAYVASLGDGPPIPTVQIEQGDLSEGGELYRANCAACHNAAGIGGALSYGNEAPRLLDVEPVQIAEAMRIGPGQMPVFGKDSFNDGQVDSIVRHIRETLRESDDPGGLSLGSAGPVTEGFVAIMVGLAAIVLSTRWITSRRSDRD